MPVLSITILYITVGAKRAQCEDGSTKRPPPRKAASKSYDGGVCSKQPYLPFETALIANRRPGSYTPMVGASHLHTFGVCSDHIRTHQRTWLLSSDVAHLRGVLRLHGKQVCKEFSPHPVSNSRRQEKTKGSFVKHCLSPILAPKQPAIRIMTAMDFKDGSGKGWIEGERVWAYREVTVSNLCLSVPAHAARPSRTPLPPNRQPPTAHTMSGQNMNTKA